jgi:hypothetical protein
MRERCEKGATVRKTILDRNVVPAEYLERIQVETITILLRIKNGKLWISLENFYPSQ